MMVSSINARLPMPKKLMSEMGGRTKRSTRNDGATSVASSQHNMPSGSMNATDRYADSQFEMPDGAMNVVMGGATHQMPGGSMNTGGPEQPPVASVPGPMVPSHPIHSAQLPEGYAASALIERALSDRLWTGVEVAAVIDEARRTGLLQVDVNTLRTPWGLTFEPASAGTTLATFCLTEASTLIVKDEGMRGPDGVLQLKAPPPLYGDAYVFNPAGRLYRSGAAPGPHWDDPLQGGINSCFHTGGTIAFANVDPERFSSLQKDNGDGSATFTFFEFDPDGTRRLVEIPVDFRVINRYTRGRDPNVLWPALHAKAWAIANGGVHMLNAANPARMVSTLSSLTGVPAASCPIPATEKELHQVLFAAREQKKAILLGSVRAESFPDPAEIPPGTPTITPGHAFAVVGIAPLNAGGQVTLRDPTGATLPVSLTALRKLFHHLVF
jgi:hypothetical protein